MEENSLEQLIQKTTIRFPKPLTLTQSEKLLKYISKNLPANINYNVEIHQNIYYNSEREGPIKSKGPVKISGMISNAKEVMGFDNFHTNNEGEDYNHIYSVNFNHFFSDLADYRPEVIKLWDDVRNIVGEYFKEVLKD